MTLPEIYARLDSHFPNKNVSDSIKKNIFFDETTNTHKFYTNYASLAKNIYNLSGTDFRKLRHQGKTLCIVGEKSKFTPAH